ncbi:YjdF family protein [Streptococcus ratti]|uniref:YjdF family protein n=1 Tax=Streptococcus ratti TaxID=1341 RepID=A0A7X9QFV6_STRRT|nr:YjdF family protein [Streptococcus ratti]NMD48623.1 YjdF family protein [Streptococcus ratti]
MKMTVYFDGAFWAALVEYVDTKGQYKAFRYVFGKEPKDEDILTFIYRDLGKWQSRCAHIDTHIEAGSSALSPKKSNPKRIQREINRAKKKPITSTKAQMAMQEIHDSLKKERRSQNKQEREAAKELRYRQKQEKRRQKKKGH